MTVARGRRAVQAEGTRLEIVAAARRLFATRGYAATTVRDIAAEAGVSVQTVYDSVGSKRRLVEALNDAIDSSAGVREIVTQAMGSPNIDDLVWLPSRVMRAILEHAGDIVRISVGARGADAALQSVRTEGQVRHRAGCRSVIAKLREVGAVRADLDDEQAAERLAALTDVEFGLMLRDHYGWSFDRIEQFVDELVRTQILSG